MNQYQVICAEETQGEFEEFKVLTYAPCPEFAELNVMQMFSDNSVCVVSVELVK